MESENDSSLRMFTVISIGNQLKDL